MRGMPYYALFVMGQIHRKRPQAGRRAESVQGAQLRGEKARERVRISRQAETVRRAKDRQRAQIRRLYGDVTAKRRAL